MAKEEQKTTAVAEPVGESPKMVRCFYRKWKVKVLLIPPERRQGQSRNEGVSVIFRRCEAFVAEKYIELLKKNRRYGTDYLTLEDLIQRFKSDPEGAEIWWDQVRQACGARKAKPPVLPSRY